MLKSLLSVKQISTRTTNNNYFFAIFVGIKFLKNLKKLAQFFQVSINVDRCPSAATDNRRQFQCLNIDLNDKTGP